MNYLMKFLLIAGCCAVTPVQKVVQMLGEMTAKGKQEKHEEQVRFAAFAGFCENTAEAKKRAIAESRHQITQLTADIVKARSDAQVLGQQILELNAQIGQHEGDKSAAEKQRAKERADFEATAKDYSESLDALERAIVVLKQQTADTKQSSLIQTSLRTILESGRVPAETKRVINSYIQDDFLSRAAPEANAYEFQSGGAVEMMEKLLHKFVEEKRSLETEEANAKHAHQTLVQSLTDQIDAANDERTNKEALKGKRETKAAEAAGDREDAQKAFDEDSKYLADLRLECDQKSFDYENRQKLRAEELVALNKAVEILSSGDVAGNADKHLPSLAQSTSFLQTHLRRNSNNRNRVVAFLTQRAIKNHSRLLSLIASKVSDDPFGKVRKMIRDMVTRLMEEANEEASHKGFCDTELATNKNTREAKTEAVDRLRSQADALTSNISQLSTQIQTLSQQIAEIDRAVQEATAQRAEEKVKNAQSIADAEAGQAAVARALKVLREFYEKAAGASSFVQGPAEDAPTTFDKPYQGQGAASGGVIGMIEVIESDFARLESETRAAEDQADDDFKRFSNDSAEDKAVKNAELTHRSHKRQRKEGELVSTNKDLAGNQKELEAAEQYYEKLKPSCVDSGLSYEERVARRKEEIESLKEALQILSADDIA
eukprot:GEMP01024644.1.p1 GENE.GEMP01024644.1~~GEMP01024644.1.p1  ORF type:complete len:660 (+),score=201.60 GEMP01024644.1:67-2046(+)